MAETIRKVPIELRKALNGLDDDTRLAIFLTLRNYKELSFSELSDKIGMKQEKSKMQFHLKQLTESALVEHKYHHQLGNEKYSYYSITKFGDSLWKNIVCTLKPPHPIQSMSDTSGNLQTDITNIDLDFSSATLTVNPSTPIIKTTKSVRKKLPPKMSTTQYATANVGGDAAP